MDWMVPRNKLDREQVSILNKIYDGRGNFFVKGCPGTGKSVVMAHLYREYIAIHPNHRVCVVTYTYALIDCIKDALRDSRLQIFTFPGFARDKARIHWDLVLVDEVQDIKLRWAEKLKNKSARIVFFGDFKQSIYSETLLEVDFLRMFTPVQCELSTIYRLTRSMKSLITTLFPENIIHAAIGNLVADSDIQLIQTDSVEDDFVYMAQKIARYAVPQKPAAVLFRRRESVKNFLRVVVPNLPFEFQLDDALNDCLRDLGSNFRFLGNGYGDFGESDDCPIVYVMTWHSAKGLDFETVALPAISESEDIVSGEATLYEAPFYVALTRGRLNLFVSYTEEDAFGMIRKMASCAAVRELAPQDDYQMSEVNEDEEEDSEPLF